MKQAFDRTVKRVVEQYKKWGSDKTEETIRSEVGQVAESTDRRVEHQRRTAPPDRKIDPADVKPNVMRFTPDEVPALDRVNHRFGTHSPRVGFTRPVTDEDRRCAADFQRAQHEKARRRVGG